MDYEAKVQVNKNHYHFLKYNNKHTWMNFWYQVTTILKLEPRTVLEIGPGNKTVTDMLKKAGVNVVTVDIDSNVAPDYVAEVTKLPFENDAFDVVLCSEVLEHIPYDLFSVALKELHRVTKKHVILGLPNAGGVLKLIIKLPIIKELVFFHKIPFFWKEHRFNGEHYWETGKKDYQLNRIKQDIAKADFKIQSIKIHHDDPAHCLFLLVKQLK